MEAIEHGIGLAVVQWLQSIPALKTLLLPFHYLGSEAFYLIALPVVYWCVNESFGRRLTLLFLLSAWTNALVKASWQRPRPFQVSSSVVPFVGATGYGVPSGHAQGAAVVAGGVGLESRSLRVVLALTAYALLVGLSRLVHGVHFPQDVLVGWTLGGFCLAVYAAVETRLVSWLRGLGLPAQLFLSAGVSGACLLLLHAFVTPDPEERRLAHAAIGTFFGASSGFAIETRYVGFRAANRSRVTRFLLGFGVLVLLYAGLSATLGPRTFARYVALGLWVGLGAPWLFVKTGLAPSSLRNTEDVA